MYKTLLLLFVVTLGFGQTQKLLIKKKTIDDWSKYPISKRIIDTTSADKKFKKRFEYLNNLDISFITYLSDGLKINGLLLEPKEKGNYPCVIFNRGGSGNFGKLTAFDAVILSKIAKEGYIVIASQYRGNGGSEGKEEMGGKDLNDVLVLPEVLKEVENADTNNIGMYGWSRGGMMTYLALTKMKNIKAAAVGGALADQYASIKDRPVMETEVLAKFVPNYYKNKTKELDKRSPVKFVDQFPKNIPILLLHGNADWRVKPEHSLRMAMEFEKYRIPYRLIMFEGSDHGIMEHKNEANQQILNWFNRFLKQKEALPNMEYHGR